MDENRHNFFALVWDCAKSECRLARTPTAISGSPAENNVIKGNKAVGATPQKIKNQASAVVEANEGFEGDNTP